MGIVPDEWVRFVLTAAVGLLMAAFGIVLIILEERDKRRRRRELLPTGPTERVINLK